MTPGFLKSVNREVKLFALAAVALAVVLALAFFPRKLGDKEITRSVILQSNDDLVEMPVDGEQTAPASERFFVQIFAFRDLNKALDARDELREKGISAEIREGEAEGSIIYRIWAGGFESRRDAEETAVILREISPKAFIVYSE